MSITDELRKYTQSWRETPNLMDDLDAGDIDGLLGDFEHIADHIDAEHERAIMSAMNDALYHANDENMAELGWVRKNKEHVISHATVEVTPHIDWSRMADELDEFVKIVRDMAGGTE